MDKCKKCGVKLFDDCIVIWTCPECGKAFKIKFSMLHKIQEWKRKNVGKNLINCSSCGYALDDGNEKIACKCSSCGNVYKGNLAYFVSNEDETNSNVEINADIFYPDMIECPECGKKILKDSKLCSYCGYPLEIERNVQDGMNGENMTASDHGAKKRTIPKNVFIIGIACVLIVVVIMIFSVVDLDPVHKYLDLVSKGNMEEANTLYEDSIVSNEEYYKEVVELQSKEIDTIYNDFVDEAISYNEAIEKIDAFIKQPSSNTYASEIKRKMEILNLSRIIYQEAVEAEAEGDMKTAILKYKEVSEEDVNYQAAQSKIDNLSEVWKENLLNEAVQYVSDGKYKEAVSNIDILIRTLGETEELESLKNTYIEMQSEQYVKVYVADKSTTPRNTSQWIFSNYVNMIFEVTNNSDKDIKGVQGVLTVYDLFGVEIISINCDFTGKTIKSGDTITVSDLRYECNDFIDSDMKLYNTNYSDLKWAYKVTSIVYTDGSTITPE